MKNKLLFNLLMPFATNNSEGKTFRNLIALVMVVVGMNGVMGQVTYTWTSGTTWLGGTWSKTGGTNAFPGDKTTTSNNDIAYFNNNTNTALTNNYINMNTQVGNHYIGAVDFGTSATTTRSISNSSSSTAGILNLNGVTLNSVANTIIWNESSATHSFTVVNTLGIGLNNATNNVIQITGTGSINIASIISGSSRKLTLSGSGSGKLNITGTANTFSNTSGTQINITGSEAVFSADLSLGALPGSVTANSIVIDGGRLTLASAFTLDSKRGIQVGATAGTSINGGGGTYNGIIADKPSTTGFWAKQGSGLLILGGASTYSGGTFINNGTVQLGASSGSNRLPTSTLVTIGTSTKTCVFDLNGNNQQIAGLVSAESTLNTVTSTGAATLTIGGSGSNTYGGTNNGTIGGAISLVMNGSGGTQTLSSENTYTGLTTVSGGTLQLNKSGGTTIPITNNVTVDGGTLQVSTNQTLNNLTLTSGTVIIDAGVTLTITGTITRTSGVIQGSATSNLVITGTSGTIAFDQTTPGTTNVLKNLTISGSGTTTLGNALNITAGSSSGTVTVGTGATLVSAGFLTLKSDANGTAKVGNSAGAITGNVTVERYIPSGKRAFRLLSPAVTTANFISNNWQQQTHITGGATGGFDITETNNPSMYTYDNQAASGTGWAQITNTNATNLTAGVGYRVLIRGDKTPANITAASANDMNVAITLSATGTLKTGTVPLSSSSTPSINSTTNIVTNGYSLVGNPYQSAVDWHLVTRTGIEDTYYAWAPNMGTGAARGNYVAYNVTSGNSGGGLVDRYIQPGQAFFVKNTGSSAGTLTFEEAHKATTNANVFRTATTPTLAVALYDPNELALGGYPIDAMKAVFSSDYSNELGLGDATKLEAAGENIAWFRNNTKLAIDAAAPVTSTDELAMKTIRLEANKNYTFKIQTTNFDTALTPYLVDNFLNTQTEISTSQAFLASFATTSNVASNSENRFKVVFNSSALNNEEWNSKSLRIYPNPVVDNQFSIAVSPSITDKVAITIYNMIGQSVYYESATAINNSIVVRPSAILKAGVYMVQMVNNGKTNTQKIIIK